MLLKRGFPSVLLLFLVIVLAGCSTMLPGPTPPPVDSPHGALDVHVDLSEVVDTPFMPTEVQVTLTRGSNKIDDTLPVADGFAEMLFERLDAASWNVIVRLIDDGNGAVTWSERIDIPKNVTVPLQLRAKLNEDALSIIPVDEDAGQEPGEEPDPGTDPGDGSDGDGGTDPGDGDDDKDNPDPVEPTITRQVRYIQSGNRTETRTEVYIIRSSEPGPTVMVVGGVHGGETSGWIVAGEVARTWEIDRGTLVVLPEANKDAVRRRVRTGRDGRDMNRAFPFGRDINRSTDWLMAREIWKIVEEFKPQALIDLHEGWGLREANDRFPGGTLSVGQTLITYPVGDAEQFADHVIRVLNRDHNPFYGTAGYTYNFRKIGPPVQGSLAYKAGRDLRIPAFIAEPTQGRAGRHQTTVEQRSKWHRAIVEEFLRWYGVRD